LVVLEKRRISIGVNGGAGRFGLGKSGQKKAEEKGKRKQ